MRIRVVLAVALLLNGALSVAEGTQPAIRQTTNIPAQSLGAALQALAKQRAFQVVYLSDVVDALKTQGASGNLTADEALQQLLSGTGLSYRYLDDSTVTIFSKNQKSANNETSGVYSGLQEIVITARRKDEALTKVPASVTAYTSEFLERQNIQSFADYATKIPNLSFQYGQGGSALWANDRETTIRGVVGIGTTAYYINDTPVPASVSPQVLDLERIEVLKGPQGTLFGASSMGGNLRFVTRKPSLSETNGTVQAQAGGTQNGGLDVDGNWQTNIALVPDRLGLDVAVGYTRDSGFVKRRFPDKDTGELITKGGEGRSDTIVGAATLRAQLSDSLEMTFNVLGQSMKMHGFPGVYVPFPSYKPDPSYVVNRAADVQESSSDRWGIGSFVLNYTGTSYSVVSSTSYFRRTIDQTDDNTEGTNRWLKNPPASVDLGNAVFYTPSHMAEDRFTHETRISFDQGALLPQLSGIAGLFYQHEYSRNRNPGIVVPEMVAAGLDPPYLADVRGSSYDNQFALFGELYYEVVPKLTVTLGLRQYWIRQKTEASTNTGFIFFPETSETTPVQNTKETGQVPKFVVSYEVGDQGNVYASVSKGFRPGGYQGKLPNSCDVDLAPLGVSPDEVRNYKSDTLWSYEVGAKTLLGNGRMNASVAAFQIDWSRIQQNAFLLTCGIGLTTNAGKARIRGGEIEIGGNPLEDVPLSLQFGLGFTDAVMRDPGILHYITPNSPLSMVPRWTGSISAYYKKPLRDQTSLFLAADYSYTDSTHVADGAGGYVTRRSLNMVNSNVGLDFGRWQIMLYGKNLLDKRLNFGDTLSTGFERYTDDGNRMPRAVVSRPRQFGLQYQLSY